jgi:signal peptidase I
LKSLLKKTYKLSPYIILAITLLLIFQLGYALARNEVPTIFNRAISYVPTESMEDEIMAGDIIIVHTGENDYQVGDVVSFLTDIDGRETNITHRIIEKNGDLFTMKGDNNDRTYTWETDVHKDDIIGIYEGWRSPIFGYVYGLLFAGSVNIVFILIILTFVLIMGFEIVNLLNTLKEKKDEEEKEQMIEEAKKKLKEEEDS